MTEQTPIDRTARVLRSPDILAREVHGEMVMIDPVAGLYFGLDEIGSDIWNRLGDEIGVGDLIDALTEDYDATPELIERDVRILLDRLQEHGLLVVR